jgi:hypothetical protein
MNKHFFSIAMLVVLLASGISAAQAEESIWSWMFSFNRTKEVAPETNKLYNDECGACHFPYQPGLLPERSWRKLVEAKALSDHFGENAELDEGDRKKILNVLVAGSADKSHYKRSKKIMNSLSDSDAPLRITEVPYIRKKHEEVVDEVVKKSDKVKSLSFCDKCHQKAKEGDFDDDTVVIPGKAN